MKLRSIDNHISDNLEQTPKDFRIKTSAKAFQILSSQLYTDKVGAVVRELSTNAQDAHKLVGKLDVPFEVHLPSALVPEFYVRDYGPGLTFEQVMTLYTTYFDSDKLHTNELTGGLGLGSKTPFAYTDAFSVSSFQDGIVRLYSAFIKDGFPQIVPLSSTATEEPDGLKVSMPVKSQDFSEFRQSAEKQLRYFFPRPNMTGQECKIEEVKYIVQEKEFALRKYDWYSKDIRIVMGPVAYPLDTSNAPEQLRQKVNELGYQSLDLFAKVGDVDIAASREGLSYDEISTKRIIKFLDHVGKHITKHVESYIAKANSMWEATCLRNSLSKNLKRTNILWRGKELKLYLEVQTNYLIAIPTPEDWRRKHLKLGWVSSLYLDPDYEKPTIVYQDDKRIPLYRTLRYNEQYLRNFNGGLLVAKFGANLPRLCEALDMSNWINMSELPAPPKPVRTSTKRKARIGFAKIQFASQYGNWGNSQEIDIGKYLAEAQAPVLWCGRDGTVSISKKFQTDQILRDLRFLKWFDEDPRPTVIGVLRSSKHIEKKLTIPHLEDWFIPRFKGHASHYDLRLMAEFERIVSDKDWRKFEGLIKDNDWREYFLEKDKNFAKIYRLFDSIPGDDFDAIYTYLNLYEKYTGRKIKPKTYYIEQAFKKFRKRFELLFTLPDNYRFYSKESVQPYLDKIR